MILNDTTPVHVHNPKKIKRKHVAVVESDPKQRSAKSYLRSAGLWTTLVSYPTGMITLFDVQFIYLLRPG